MSNNKNIGQQPGINLPPVLIRIGIGSFCGCSSIENVICQNKLAMIDDMAFKDCIKLEKINLPSSLRFIGKHAFENCAKLIEARIPIGCVVREGAFKGCSNTEVYMSRSSIPDVYEGIEKDCIVKYID